MICVGKIPSISSKDYYSHPVIENAKEEEEEKGEEEDTVTKI